MGQGLHHLVVTTALFGSHDQGAWIGSSGFVQAPCAPGRFGIQRCRTVPVFLWRHSAPRAQKPDSTA